MFLMMNLHLPTINDKPPTLYSLLQSIVNYEKDDKTKIKDLAKEGRTTIFNFDYPLTEKINKETFETMILNHFLMRRIGFETFTAFQIQLNVKMNEIMPLYNKLFELLYDNLAIGDVTVKEGFDNRISETKQNGKNTTNLKNETETKNNNISDRRYSDTPENQLSNIRNGDYATNYNYDTNTNESNDTASSIGTATNDSNTNINDNKNYKETTTHINMFELYQQFNAELKNIYSMLFNDLDVLFYQLI